MKDIILFIGLFLFTSSITGQTKSQKRIEKDIKKTENYSKTKTLIDTKTFVFKPNWVNPICGGQINIDNDGYYLKIDNNSISIYLPYFGRVYSSGYGTDVGIEVEGIVKDYAVNHNNIKRRTTIEFSTKNDSEYFDIFLTIFSNGNSTLTIIGANRNSINYNGKIMKLPED